MQLLKNSECFPFGCDYTIQFVCLEIDAGIRHGSCNQVEVVGPDREKRVYVPSGPLNTSELGVREEMMVAVCSLGTEVENSQAASEAIGFFQGLLSHNIHFALFLLIPNNYNRLIMQSIL